MLSYKFRIYPSKIVQTKLNEQLELCRWLYNRLLYELNKAREEGRKITQKDTQALIVKIKNEEKPELKKVHSKVLQMVNYQLWSNIKALSALKKNGRKIGKLRYKSRNRYKTLNYNQSGFKIEKNKLILSKIGSIPVKIHREIDGEIKGVIIKRYPSGKWYALFQVEKNKEILPKTENVVGIDVGVRYFLTDSDGRQVKNPKYYERTLNRIKKLQKELSRKQKGSKNREKARIKLAKAYEKLVNQRDDFLHKLSRFYVDNYDVIVVEDLNIRSMVRNHNLAQKILDASWGKFFRMLSYKAGRAGRRVVFVNPRGTSEGLSFDDPFRDYISANRILSRGSCQPVERRPLLRITALAVITGQASSMKQEAPYVG